MATESRVGWSVGTVAVASVACLLLVAGCKDKPDDAKGRPPTIHVPSDMDGLRIKMPGSDEVSLVKTAGTWAFSTPTSGNADQAKVQAVVENLVRLRLDDDTNGLAAPADLSAYELDPGHAVHVTATKAGQAVLDASFGKAGGGENAVRLGPDPAVYSVIGYSSSLYGGVDRFRAADPVATAANSAKGDQARTKVSWYPVPPMNPVDPQDPMLTFCARHGIAGKYVGCRSSTPPQDDAIFTTDCPALAQTEGCKRDPTENDGNRGRYYCCP